MINKQIILTAGQKARRINKDKTIYGSFVEIGAGQEVARQFFRVGSASKTLLMTETFQMLFTEKNLMADMFVSQD